MIYCYQYNIIVLYLDKKSNIFFTMHDKNNYLKGGRENQIIRIENTVHRPTGFWTSQVHKFLHGFGSIDEQITRARIFCDAYGLSNQEREEMPEMIVQRLQSLVDYMLEQAEKGNQTMVLNIQEGHHLLYLANIEYINAHIKDLHFF